jgi:hypothetical protein
MIKIPPDADLIPWPGARMWFDASGIVYAISEKTPEQTVEKSRQALQEFKKLTGGQRKCLMLDITRSSPTSKAVRDYVATEMVDITMALALLSGSSLGRMIANLFLKIKPPEYPARIFSNEEDARTWLMTFLQPTVPVKSKSGYTSN